jgi:hypothetical protein
MKQKNIIKKMYKACIEHNLVKQKKLYMEEMRKIFKHKESGKQFSPKWIVIQ